METIRDYLALAVMLLALWPGSAAGAVPGAPPPGKPGEEFPLHIIANKLEADQNAGIAIFTGKVKATYGESILYADQLKVYFIPKQAGAAAKATGPKGAAAGAAPRA
ncbi:MAG: LptA/OstA family protein, partial [Desulfobaccales bacterium]